MMKQAIFVRYLVIFVVLFAFGSTAASAGEPEKFVSFSIYGGGLWGGVYVPKSAENVSGEMGFGWHAGAESEFNIRGEYFIASGLDYAQYGTTVTYDDPAAGYDGKHDVTLGLLRMPITYNFRLLRDDAGYPTLFLKPGAFVGYYVSDKVEETGDTPEFEFEEDVTYGFLLSTGYYPFPIAEKVYLGLSANGYWSVPVYRDDTGLEASLVGVDLGLSLKFF